MTYINAIQFACAVMLVQIILLLVGGYYLWPHIDIPMHFAGGAAMGMLGLAIWNENIISIKFTSKLFSLRPWVPKMLFIICFATFMGVLWEFFEFGQDYFFGRYSQPSLQDTLGDLFFDILGGMSMVIFTFKK